MRKLVSIAAILLGVVGTLASIAGIGFGWWVAARTEDRVSHVAERVDQGLSDADAGLAQTEARLAAIRADVDKVRSEAEKLAAENPELPRLQAAADRLLDRFTPTLDRAATLATLLRSVAAGLRSAAAIRDLLPGGHDHPPYAENAAAGIERAAGVLNIPQAKIDSMRATAAAQLVRDLIAVAREVAAGSEWLAKALVDARQEVAVARKWTADWRDKMIFWAFAAATANTLVWVWIGLGQLSLMSWGRRRMISTIHTPSDATK